MTADQTADKKGEGSLAEQAERLRVERDHWHDAFKVLAKACVGETGLSAIDIVNALRDTAKRLVAAEAERDRLQVRVAELEAALAPVDGTSREDTDANAARLAELERLVIKNYVAWIAEGRDNG